MLAEELIGIVNRIAVLVAVPVVAGIRRDEPCGVSVFRCNAALFDSQEAGVSSIDRRAAPDLLQGVRRKENGHSSRRRGRKAGIPKSCIVKLAAHRFDAPQLFYY